MTQILNKAFAFLRYISLLKGWRRLFSIDSLLKVLFMYFVVILTLSFIIIDFPKNFFDHSHKYKKITVLANMDRMGEFQIFKRTMFGCRNLEEFQCLGVHLPEDLMRYSLTRHFLSNSINLVNLFFKPDFNLLTTHIMYLLPVGYNVFYINVPYELIIGLDKAFHHYFPLLKNADAFLDLNYFSTGNKFFLEEAIRKNDKKASIIPGILIVQNNEYAFAEPRNMVLSGSLWGANRGSLRLSEVFRRFGYKGKFFAYGPEEYLGHLEDGYAGLAKSSGVHYFDEDIIPIHKRHGISLVVHNFDHLMGSVPTTRIAESIAAGTIVISDNHPFISKYFGDNVLYFDSFGSTDKIYNDINSHLEWIKNHPEEIKLKTRRAHEILMKNFCTEVQIPKIYDDIMQAKKSDSLL